MDPFARRSMLAAVELVSAYMQGEMSDAVRRVHEEGLIELTLPGLMKVIDDLLANLVQHYPGSNREAIWEVVATQLTSFVSDEDDEP